MTKAEKRMHYMEDTGIIDAKKFTLLQKHDTFYTKLKKLLKEGKDKKIRHQSI
jgi:hypothetical protein